MTINVFLGKLGSGKTFQSYKRMEIDKDLNPIQIRLPFAFALKEFLSEIGITKEANNYLHKDSDYTHLRNKLQVFLRKTPFDDSQVYKLHEIFETKTPRECMQYFGTDFLRNTVSLHFHTTRVLEVIKSIHRYANPSIYIDDLRFLSEAEALLRFQETNYPEVTLKFFHVVTDDKIRRERLNLTQEEFDLTKSHESETELDSILDLFKEKQISFSTICTKGDPSC
jgi:hypothetical protein